MIENPSIRAGEPGQRRLVWLLAYAVAIAIPAIGWSYSFPVDDAWITLHNARSLIAGSDLVYGVSPLVGATSAAHLALMALLGLAVPLPLASLILGLAAAFTYALALDRALGNAGARAPVLVLAGLLAGSVPLQLLNGLETGMAMATVAGLLALADDRRLPLLAGLAPFVRPELGLLALLLLGRQCWGASPAVIARTLGLAGAMALPWLGWIYAETGQLIPATASAKIAFFAEDQQSFPSRLLLLGTALSASFLLPFFVIGLVGAQWHVRVFVLAVLAVAVLTLPGSMAWNDGRYQAPLLPALLVGIAGLRELRSGRLVLGLLCVWTVALLPHHIELLSRQRAANSRSVAAFQHIGGSLPPGTRVLVHDAGMIAWAAPHLKLTDAVGLKTPPSADFHRRYTRRSCEWDHALDAIARRNHVAYAVVLEEPFWRCVGTNLARAGWLMTEIGPGSDTRYRFYRVAPPEPR